MDILPTLEAGSVDAVITDPPYGIGESNQKNLSRGGFSTPKWKRAQAIDYGDFNWDKEPATAEQLLEIQRVSKNQVIFGGNHFALPRSSGWIVWDKLNGESDFSDCELAWTSYPRGIRKFTYLWAGFLKQKPEERYHPTQKPLALMLWVIENYTQPGDTVLDPFAGVGTTGVACVQLGRNFIGIEIDPRYHSIAEKRIADAQRQMRLEI
jgi:DNA modification methylase